MNKKKYTSGFSLVEALVIIFIISLIGVVVFTFYMDILSLNTTISGSLTIQDAVRKVLKEITTEVRPLSPSSAGAYPIAEANPTSFIFYSDIDGDQLKERVRYFLNETTFKKGVIKPSGNPLIYNSINEIISNEIYDIKTGTDLIFEYYDKNYDGTTPSLTEPINILSVRLVKITIVIDKDPNKAPGPITFTTQVSMRNLKDNQ